MTARLVYLVTEDWAFWRHRLPMACAARDAGFDVHLIANVKDRGDLIRNEGFTVHPLNMHRGSLSPAATLTAIVEVRKRLVALEPDLIHNVALKPVVIGTVAARGLDGVAVVNSINGLGSAFIATDLKGRLLRASLERTLRALHNHQNTRIIVQNPEDRAAVCAVGIDAGQLVLIPGSGVDIDRLQPMPEPAGDTIRFAFVGRMLDDKGLRSLIRAFRLVHAQMPQTELLLAGEPDPQNPTSIPDAEFAGWSREPGIRMLGHVEDIAGVWKQAHIAVLPSRGEGLPKCLLEAAACGRSMVATDVPGCRQIAIEGETGRVAPVNDDAALAAAMVALARDPESRARFGANARALTAAKYSAAEIGRQTLALYRDLLPDSAG